MANIFTLSGELSILEAMLTTLGSEARERRKSSVK
jgi:hypothetical protein